MQKHLIRAALVTLMASVLGACSTIEPPRYGNYGGLAGIGSEPAPQTPKAPQTPIGLNPADACDVAQPAGICWYPASARFHPDGQRLVVNLCSNRHGAAYYCRMVEYQVNEKRWSLVPGQEDGKSYLYPAYAHDGKSMVFVIDDCAKPWCRGGQGVGQLATMSVRAGSAGQAASYGAATRLSVNGATRPNFAPDDQSLVYWRGRHSARLSSGRVLSSVSVYRYTPKTDTEEHAIPSLYTDKVAAYFTVPLSAPHFSSDGKVLRFSVMHDSSLGHGSSSLDQGSPDVQVRLSDGAFEGRRTARVKEGLGQVFSEHPKLGYLAGPGNLRLVDAKTLETRAVYLDPGYSQVASADFNAQGDSAVAVSGTLSVTDGSHVLRRDHFLYVDDPKDLRKQVRIAPILALIDLVTPQVKALEWPNVEALTR